MREKERSCRSQCFYCTQLLKSTQIEWISIRNATVNLLSKGEETEEEEVVDMGGVGSEIEDSEHSSVDIGNTLDPDGLLACRILSLGVTQRPPVVTIFGRAVGVGYLEK